MNCDNKYKKCDLFMVLFNPSALNEDIEKFYDEYDCLIKILYKYSTEFNGFLAKISDSTLSQIKSHPLVDRVELNTLISIHQTEN